LEKERLSFCKLRKIWDENGPINDNFTVFLYLDELRLLEQASSCGAEESTSNMAQIESIFFQNFEVCFQS